MDYSFKLSQDTAKTGSEKFGVLSFRVFGKHVCHTSQNDYFFEGLFIRMPYLANDYIFEAIFIGMAYVTGANQCRS